VEGKVFDVSFRALEAPAAAIWLLQIVKCSVDHGLLESTPQFGAYPNAETNQPNFQAKEKLDHLKWFNEYKSNHSTYGCYKNEDPKPLGIDQFRMDSVEQK
jgi:hypothetical protein